MNETSSNPVSVPLAIEAQKRLDAMDIAEIEVAADEVSRELGVRQKCFPRWITEGKLSKTDANDRLTRIKKAAFILRLLLDSRAEPC